VGLRAFAIGAGWVSHCVIREFGIKHAEAVVVLGGEHHVFHACIFGGFGPTFWVELCGVKGFLKLFIVTNVVEVGSCIGPAARAPVFVFGANAPAFDHAPLAVGAPVHE
ncbi:MAG: hypothetical protein RIR94_675, partial [Bacteroidota bacterium]